MRKFLLITISITLFGCQSQNVYPATVKKYHNDDEVYMNITLPTGHIEEIICAFPPGTDYGSIKSVRVGDVREVYMLGEKSHYCNPEN